MSGKENPKGEEETPLLFATFLESIPPGSSRPIEDLFENRPGSYGVDRWCVSSPEIQLHCSSETCSGTRIFKTTDTAHFIEKGLKNIFTTYFCRNCGKGWKTYALRVAREGLHDEEGHALKFGELPFFGPPLPSRLISMIGPDREPFLKGRRAENQGLGIGAFGYYRRVVENQKGRLFDEIFKAAERLGANPEVLESIERAKRETRFSKAVDEVKDAIPDGLKVKGHNPLKLLHKALSKGIHEMTDEECLERAQAIRVVLTELVGNISQVMKNEHELDSAVSKLLSLD